MLLYASVVFVWLYCMRYFLSWCLGFAAAVIVNVLTFYLHFIAITDLYI